VTNRPLVLATLEGYCVEGGFDRAHEPATCYSPTIALGRHAGPGAADNLWSDYELVLDLAAGLGLDGVRLGLEWARIEPRRGVVDEGALDRYREVALHARSLGLVVTVTLIDAAWPSWLGLEAWLLPWVAPHVISHARRVVDYLGAAASGVLVFADADALVRGGYLDGSAPPWRRGALDDAASARAQIEAILHVLGEDPQVGPKLVHATRTIALDLAPEQIVVERSRAVDCAEIYVRSLVKGAGPTSAPAGLLVQRAGQWSVCASPDLLGALG
jgi:beta-glucosidase/6-phospho-beta-glucosidase/beta-galactosidase